VRGLAVTLVALAACSFEHGAFATGDGGRGDGKGGDGPMLVTRRLLLNNAASATDFKALEVLVVLDATRVDYGLVDDPRTDLRFEDEGTKADLPFDVEKWDETGESLVWVRVENVLANSTDHAVLLHFGAGANGMADPYATWADWTLVQHFIAGLENAASASYKGTAINTTLAPGQIGDAAVFTGTGNQQITFAGGSALFNGWTAFTLMFWLNTPYTSATLIGEPSVVERYPGLTDGRMIDPSGTQVQFQLDVQFASAPTSYLNTSMPANTWKLVTYTSNGTTLHMYGNATSQGSDPASALQTGAGSLVLGSSFDPFAGKLDELRVAQRYLSIDEVRAHHLIMTRQFVTFAAP
jgi:hypothetical protein